MHGHKAERWPAGELPAWRCTFSPKLAAQAVECVLEPLGPVSGSGGGAAVQAGRLGSRFGGGERPLRPTAVQAGRSGRPPGLAIRGGESGRCGPRRLDVRPCSPRPPGGGAAAAAGPAVRPGVGDPARGAAVRFVRPKPGFVWRCGRSALGQDPMGVGQNTTDGGQHKDAVIWPRVGMRRRCGRSAVRPSGQSGPGRREVRTFLPGPGCATRAAVGPCGLDRPLTGDQWCPWPATGPESCDPR
jgi:hypothetical protein